MLGRLRKLFFPGNAAAPPPAASQSEPAPPPEILVPGTHHRFALAGHMRDHLGFPLVDWDAVGAWVDHLDGDELCGRAWAAAEHAWLLHLRSALGPRYRLVQSDTAMLLSPLAANVAQATLDTMDRTLVRVIAVLDGIAAKSPWGKDILIVFATEEQYYDYVSHCYPATGEFAFSSGMFIAEGCAHFVTVQSDLRAVEPVIAHEMTHACLAHLPIPLWLNEGLAVNTEHRLAGSQAAAHTAQEMRAKHLAFWGPEEIRAFWSGASFSRTDDGNMLSYDLARILVAEFAKDWPRFRQFVLEANWQDAGAEAARRHLGASLGSYAAALLEKEHPDEFEPVPAMSAARPAGAGAPEKMTEPTHVD